MLYIYNHYYTHLTTVICQDTHPPTPNWHHFDFVKYVDQCPCILSSNIQVVEYFLFITNNNFVSKLPTPPPIFSLRPTTA